jgi:ribonuclease HI
METLTFGKYKNLNFDEIYNQDKQYLEWLNTQPWYKIKFKESRENLIKFLNIKKENIIINPDTIIIYTDGACKHNGSKTKNVRAGIGIHFSLKNRIQLKDISLKLDIKNPTNNKAELTAILVALQECEKNNLNEKIIIYTDSQYSIDAITKWYDQWIINGNLNSKKNIDILKKIKEYLKIIDVKFIHIRSHTNLQDEHSIGNDKADKLAVACL